MIAVETGSPSSHEADRVSLRSASEPPVQAVAPVSITAASVVGGTVAGDGARTVSVAAPNRASPARPVAA